MDNFTATGSSSSEAKKMLDSYYYNPNTWPSAAAEVEIKKLTETEVEIRCTSPLKSFSERKVIDNTTLTLKDGKLYYLYRMYLGGSTDKAGVWHLRFNGIEITAFKK